MQPDVYFLMLACTSASQNEYHFTQSNIPRTERNQLETVRYCEIDELALSEHAVNVRVARGFIKHIEVLHTPCKHVIVKKERRFSKKKSYASLWSLSTSLCSAFHYEGESDAFSLLHRPLHNMHCNTIADSMAFALRVPWPRKYTKLLDLTAC